MGGGIGMGNICKPLAVSFQCMTKSTTNKKKTIKKILNNSKPKENVMITFIDGLNFNIQDKIYSQFRIKSNLLNLIGVSTPQKVYSKCHT